MAVDVAVASQEHLLGGVPGAPAPQFHRNPPHPPTARVWGERPPPQNKAVPKPTHPPKKVPGFRPPLPLKSGRPEQSPETPRAWGGGWSNGENLLDAVPLGSTSIRCKYLPSGWYEAFQSSVKASSGLNGLK